MGSYNILKNRDTIKRAQGTLVRTEANKLTASLNVVNTHNVPKSFAIGERGYRAKFGRI